MEHPLQGAGGIRMKGVQAGKKIIVGITGASGVVLGYRLLEALHASGEAETYLTVSKSAVKILSEEAACSYEALCGLADHVYDCEDMGAAISSGSFRTDGMIVIPCSMKTLSAIANAYDDNLIVRAADVCLKENRRTVLVPREMPFNSIHIRNMKLCADAGYVIMPPVMTFYNHPVTMEEQIRHFIGKIMMQFDLNYDKFKPWQGGTED